MNTGKILSIDSIESFRDSLSEQGRSSNTIKAYSTDLRMLLAWVGSDSLDHKGLVKSTTSWMNSTRATASPKTTERRMTSVKAYARWARIKKADSLSEYSLPTKSIPRPHPIPEGIEGIKTLCERANDPRRSALFALQGMLGLRVSEALSVTAESFDLQYMTLKVRGKGDRERVLPITEISWRYIKPAFERALTSGGRVVDLPDRTARYAVTTAGKRLGFERSISSHDLRATAATALYERTKDLRLVQEFLGHASSKTTELYVAVTMDNMREGLKF